jgi:hypothetical protein
VLTALAECGLTARSAGASVEVALPAGDVRDQVVVAERVRLLAHAHGWVPHSDTALSDTVTISPVTP